MVRSIGKLAGANAGDLVLIVAGQGGVPAKEPGSAARVKPALDALRRSSPRSWTSPTRTRCSFAFVVDFPLFEWDDDDERWDATHHLFTSLHRRGPRPARQRPGRGAQQRLRHHLQRLGDRQRQHPDPPARRAGARCFELLGISEDEAREKFGHMLEAFEYGAPPHGGIAPGIDRTVALFAQESDIREVIAFPKTKSATDLMTGAPSPVDQAALDVVGLMVKPKPR